MDKQLSDEELAKRLLKFIEKDELLDNVRKLQKQMTHEQALRLVHLYSRDEIRETLYEMANHAPLPKKYKSVSLTLEQWIKLKRKKAAFSQKLPSTSATGLFTYDEALNYCHKQWQHLDITKHFDMVMENGKKLWRLK